MNEKKYTLDDINSANIINIAEHFIDSDFSLRVFAQEYCEFSYWTLRDKFLHVLPFIEKSLYEQVVNCLQERKAKNIKEDALARLRTLSSIDLLLKKDFTVAQIAQELNTTPMIIYRDLTKRAMSLDEISEETKAQILNKLQDHSRYNLVNKGR